MKKSLEFLTALIAVWFLDIPLGHSCKCGADEPFLTVVHRSDFIAVVRVEKYYKIDGFERAVDARVMRILNGTEKRKRIRIWGDDGKLCRPYVTSFPLKTEWVMALRPNSIDKEDTDDYAISVCGEYSLSCAPDSVFGRIDADSTQRLSWKIFEEKLKSTLNPR